MPAQAAAHGLLKPETLASAQALLAATQPSGSGVVTRELYDGRRIILCLLPTLCSRHNCRAQPHALRKALMDLALDRA